RGTRGAGGVVLLRPLRGAPPRSFAAALAEHADEHALGELASACGAPVHVRDAAVQLARLAGGCGEASLALVEDDHAVAQLPAITIGGVGCLGDGDAPTAPLG